MHAGGLGACWLSSGVARLWQPPRPIVAVRASFFPRRIAIWLPRRTGSAARARSWRGTPSLSPDSTGKSIGPNGSQFGCLDLPLVRSRLASPAVLVTRGASGKLPAAQRPPRSEPSWCLEGRIQIQGHVAQEAHALRKPFGPRHSLVEYAAEAGESGGACH